MLNQIVKRIFGSSVGWQSAAHHGSDCVQETMISENEEEKTAPEAPVAQPEKTESEEAK